jgi:hypothetical protein
VLRVYLHSDPMRLRLLVTSFASCGVSFVAGQPSATPKSAPPPEPLPAIFAPRPPAKAPKGRAPLRSAPTLPPSRRAISPETAAKLSAVATQAAPPAAAASPTTPATVPPADPDTVQLNPFLVQEDRLPEFKEREMLTPKGKLALARRRYPGLVGPFSDATALRKLEDDFAKERRQELSDLRGLSEISGAKPSRELKRQIDDAAMRSGFSVPMGEPFRPPR